MSRARRHRPERSWLIAALIAAAAGRAPAAGAEPSVVDGFVTYEALDGIFIDAGADQGLKAGDRGTVRRDGKEIAQVEVVSVSKSSSLLRILSGRQPSGPKVGDSVSLLASGAGEEAPAPGKGERSPTLKDRRKEEDGFTPLLTSPDRRSQAHAEPANIFHGQLRLRELFQVDAKTQQDYSISRIDSSGNLQRIRGGPWMLDWSGNLSYRAGQALENSPDFEEPRLDIFRLSLFRRFDDDSSLRAGRFISPTLPSAGYLDGVQAEKVVNERWRLGVMAGFKPSRDQLALSVKEPTVVPYASVQTGNPERLSYAGTFGLLASMYEGDPGRVAFLLDQTLRVGRRLTIYCSSQVDFDIGGRETRTGTQLSQLDAAASYELTASTTLRTGVDHYQRLDSPAERDLLPFYNPDFFDRGFWRYYLGASQRLPWELTLSGEVAFIDSPTDDKEPHWRMSLTRAGLPYLPSSWVTATLYNLEGSELNGSGGSVSGFFPILDDRVTLEAAFAFRTMETNLDGSHFNLNDITARVNWALNRAWSLNGGGTYSYGGGLSRVLFDFGVTFRW